MNFREQRMLWRIGKMRANLQAAQVRMVREGHSGGDTCPCPACTFRRALTGAMAGGIPGVTVVRMGGEEPAPPAVDADKPKTH